MKFVLLLVALFLALGTASAQAAPYYQGTVYDCTPNGDGSFTCSHGGATYQAGSQLNFPAFYSPDAQKKRPYLSINCQDANGNSTYASVISFRNANEEKRPDGEFTIYASEIVTSVPVAGNCTANLTINVHKAPLVLDSTTFAVV